MRQSISIIMTFLTLSSYVAAIPSSFEERRTLETICKQHELPHVNARKAELEEDLGVSKPRHDVEGVRSIIYELPNIHHKREAEALIDHKVHHDVCGRDDTYEEIDKLAVYNHVYASPKPQDPVPKIQNSRPKNHHSKLNNQQPRPKNQKSRLKNQSSRPKNQKPAPKNQRPRPKPHHSRPKNHNSTPKNRRANARGQHGIYLRAPNYEEADSGSIFVDPFVRSLVRTKNRRSRSLLKRSLETYPAIYARDPTYEEAEPSTPVPQLSTPTPPPPPNKSP